MKKKYVIILSEGKEYLCCHEDGCYYDVSCPMRSFTEGEEDFEIMDSGQNRHGNTYPYHKRKLKLVPGFYPNGWLAFALFSILSVWIALQSPVYALSLEVPKTGEAYTVLTVNLEDFPAFGIPDRAFVDINNNPEAMDFLIRYNLAGDTGYRRRSGWMEYPMVKLNLPELYRISPVSFEESGQQSIM